VPRSYNCDVCDKQIKDNEAVAVSAATGKVVTKDSPMARLAGSLGVDIDQQEVAEIESVICCSKECAITWLITQGS
jgi:hypothetical protein